MYLGWRDWDYLFTKLFKCIPSITKYQHFRFTATKQGQVFVCSSCTSDEKVISILKKKVTVAAIKRKGLPEVIPQAGLTADRKRYLYEICPFVTPEYQDITCPPPWKLSYRTSKLAFLCSVQCMQTVISFYKWICNHLYLI